MCILGLLDKGDRTKHVVYRGHESHIVIVGCKNNRFVGICDCNHHLNSHIINVSSLFGVS